MELSKRFFRLTYFLTSLIIVVSCTEEKTISMNDLRSTNGIHFEENSTTPFSGKAIGYFKNGDLKQVTYFKNGKGEETSTRYYKNGKKQFEINLKEGQNDGAITVWYPDGQKHIEGNFNNGKKDGYFRTWYPNGQKKLEVYYENGDLIDSKGWNKKGLEIIDKRILKNYIRELH